ncbi:MAG: PPC domain-containing protein [Spirochaetes bacterium]|nr:PPC domain-containing protein [Spirochaetota bacterium]
MKKCLYIFIPVLFLAAYVSCKNNIITENEPNDNYYSANKINTDSIVEGTLETEEDHDFFRFDIMSSAVVDIELSAVKGLNHAVKIWKEGGQILKYIDDARKSSPEKMCNMFFDSGVYYIEILHGDRDKAQGNAENNYTLRFVARDWDSEETESNDSFEKANFLQLGKEISGFFSPSFNKLNQSTEFAFREEDWYYFDLELIDEIPMLLDVSLSGVPDVNSALYILNADRSEIASSNTGSAGESESLEGIGITASGRYYIMVSSNFESNNSIQYVLQTSLKSYDYSSEIEPNNKFENANIIKENEITGRIYPDGDRDYYIITDPASDLSVPESGSSAVNYERLQYRIEVQSEGTDILLKIFDKNKRQLFEVDNINGGGIEILPNAVLDYNSYIEISSRRMEIPGSEYRLNFSPFRLTDDYEVEPNNIKENANKIIMKKTMGFVSGKNDIDYFILEFKSRVKTKIILHGIEGAELKISVTDPLGFIIKSETVKGSNSATISEMIDQKGYLIIESIADNYNKPYTVELGE